MCCVLEVGCAKKKPNYGNTNAEIGEEKKNCGNAIAEIGKKNLWQCHCRKWEEKKYK